MQEKQIPDSLFESLKNKTKTFTSKEREEIWKNKWEEDSFYREKNFYNFKII